MNLITLGVMAVTVALFSGHAHAFAQMPPRMEKVYLPHLPLSKPIPPPASTTAPVAKNTTPILDQNTPYIYSGDRKYVAKFSMPGFYTIHLIGYDSTSLYYDSMFWKDRNDQRYWDAHPETFYSIDVYDDFYIGLFGTINGIKYGPLFSFPCKANTKIEMNGMRFDPNNNLILEQKNADPIVVIPFSILSGYGFPPK